MSRIPPLPRPPRPVLIGGVLALGLGGLSLGWILLFGPLGGEIARGTSVQGVDIGGLSPEEAEDRLSVELADSWAAPLPVLLGGEQTEQHAVEPATAGLRVDVGATVAQADRPGLLRRLLGAGGGELEPVVTQDTAAARTGLTALANSWQSAVQEGAVAFVDGEVEVTEPAAGIVLDVTGSLGPLRDAYPFDADAGPVRLPVWQAEPRTDQREVERALAEFAEPAMSGPVTLTAGDRRIPIPPAVIGDHLALTADQVGTLRPELDGEALAGDERLAEAFAAAAVEPVEGTLRLDSDRVVFDEPGEPGSRVAPEAVGEAVLPLLTRVGDAARTGPVDTEPVEPTLSRDTYRELGLVEEMSSFTVEFEPADYRTTNIGRAAELIDGSLVLPDDTWSFNERVGERTEENGFVEGVIILDDRYQRAQGGGVSAVATTVYNAIFFAGVKPLEHGAHSFYIERYPEGREATVAWGSLDLSFLNDSGNAVYILADATDTSVTVTFLGTRKYDQVRADTGPRENVREPETRRGEGEDCVPQPPLEGFDVEVQRVFVDDGEEVGRESYTTSYVPRDEILCPVTASGSVSAREAEPDPAPAQDPPVPGGGWPWWFGGPPY
ncbi:VanW family protein [Streptomyces millisiae]|uniref:VanW family protein n=1 Tax=Streptomyces millisiae TaxID=3075542 RepID=A0ABU2LMV5_9ACTN|nr:VanW family protein [Streptomyces sp. DSM 44918]MDT0318917.1 VanW family protein [Streptomyces sp. DSM 44918]